MLAWEEDLEARRATWGGFRGQTVPQRAGRLTPRAAAPVAGTWRGLTLLMLRKRFRKGSLTTRTHAATSSGPRWRGGPPKVAEYTHSLR